MTGLGYAALLGLLELQKKTTVKPNARRISSEPSRILEMQNKRDKYAQMKQSSVKQPK